MPLFGNRTKETQKDPNQKNPESEDQRWRRWVNGNFIDFMFTTPRGNNKVARWLVTKELSANTWQIHNTDTLEKDEVSVMFLTRALSEQLYHKNTVLEREINGTDNKVAGFLEDFEWIEKQLLIEKRNATVKRVLDAIDTQLFNGHPYRRPSEAKKDQSNGSNTGQR